MYEDSKGVNQKNRQYQYNDQKTKDKRTNNDLQKLQRKLEFEKHEPQKKPG